MTPATSFGRTTPRPAAADRRSGFAIVVALGVMAFIVLLLVSLTSVIQVNTVASNTMLEEARARQNALLSLQVALGTLQEEMGPDRRISATAALLDTDPGSAEIDDVGQPFWTGVWNPAVWDRSTNPEFVVPSPTGASDGKPAKFRRWLVSGEYDRDTSKEQEIQRAVLFGSQTPDAVLLVGEGTLGEQEEGPGEVYVERMSFAESPSRENGYAFWIGDEGVKARIGGPVPEVPEDEIDKLFAIASQAKPSLNLFSGWESVVDLERFEERIIGYRTAEKVVTDAVGSETAFDEKFHSMTAFSTGLLTDVRSGGFRRDLSQVLAADRLPRGFDDEFMFQIGAVRGPTWNYVKRYHDRYKLLDTLPAGGAFFRTSDVHSEIRNDLTPSKPGDTPTPVVVRFQYLFSMYQGYNTVDGRPLPDEDLNPPLPEGELPVESNHKIVYLMITPVIYLWNPYNVTIEMDSNPEGTGAIEILPGLPPLQLSLDNGGTWVTLGETVRDFAGELFAAFTSNHARGESFEIPPGGIFINTLEPLSYLQKLAIEDGLRVEAFGRARGDNFSPNPGFIDNQEYSRWHNLKEDFEESDLGFFTPLVQPRRPGSNGRSMKRLATGFANLRVRFDPNQTRFIVKTSLGAGRLLRASADIPQDQSGFADRGVIGVMNIVSRSPINSTFVQTEYAHNEVIPLGSLNDMVVVSGNNLFFTGQAPLFALNYDIRAFEEVNTIGKPGLFVDPTNGFFYSLDADDRAFATAPFRFSFTRETDNPVQFDPQTGRPAFRTERSDLIASNVARELPTVPMVSIGQLESAPLGRDYTHLVYQYTDYNAEDALRRVRPGSRSRRNMAPMFNHPVGNSFAHPAIPVDAVWGERADPYAADIPFLLNDLLFDTYIFSGLAEPSGPFVSGSGADRRVENVISNWIAGVGELPNSSYQFRLPTGINIGDADLWLKSENPLLAAERFAAFVQVPGSFNVNSTSVDAWAAQLSGLRDATVLFDDGEGAYQEIFEEEATPVLNQTVPVGASLETIGQDTGRLYSSSWSHYRALNDEQIQILAEKIVEQVKARGPFLSLGQFFNRELSGRAAYNLTGPVQAAIDEAGLNRGLSGEESSGLATALEKRFNSYPVDEGLVGSANFEVGETLYGDVNEGLAGYLSQADILKPLAPKLNARSDTFIIRTYGDVVLNGEVRSRVWCEAVAQRRAPYLESASDQDTNPTNGSAPWERPLFDTENANSAISELNQRYGRKFEIISFRWLNKNEV